MYVMVAIGMGIEHVLRFVSNSWKILARCIRNHQEISKYPKEIKGKRLCGSLKITWNLYFDISPLLDIFFNH